jgi:MFS family permease
VKTREHQGQIVIASLFVTLFLVFGSGYNTAGVFFTPMIQHFGWSKTRLSSLQTALALAAGATVPAVGWLLDKLEARFVIFAGIVVAGSAFIIISRAHSYGVILIAYALLGIGISAATLLPCSVVVANWFDERRGTALGIVMAGTSVGGMVMTFVAQHVVEMAGWRIAFMTLALPMFLVAAPLVLATVSTRPEGGRSLRLQNAAPLSGLEVGQALRKRCFWMIAVAQFAYSFASGAATLYTISYLVLNGYKPAHAAAVWESFLASALQGSFLPDVPLTI